MSIKFNPFTASFDYVRDVTAPILLSGDDISLDYNTTNLKLTASQLDTIQGISTAASPTFTGLTLSGLTAGSIPFAGASGVISQSNANLFWNNANSRLGILTASPTNALSFGGNAARTIWMERHTTANTAGNNLTIQAGGATSAATNKAGGKLILSSGTATGTQTSSVEIWTAAGGASGTADRAPSVKFAVGANGQVTMTQAPSASLTGVTQNLTQSGTAAGISTLGSSWNFTHAAMQDSTLTGLQMQIQGTIAASDTGGSVLQGFAFEIYENGTGVGANASAVGGFIRHSSTLAGLIFTGVNVDVQTGSGAGACDIVLYETGVSAFNASVTSWTALHVNNPVPTVGTITDVYGIRIEDLTGGTNNYAIHSSGGQSVHAGNLKLGDTTAPTEQLEFADAKNIKFQTTTGTKIGTATSQKIGFWNATPVAQQTTGVGAATRVGGGGAAVTDTDTFDGYTIAKVVKALRNIGVLA